LLASTEKLLKVPPSAIQHRSGERLNSIHRPAAVITVPNDTIKVKSFDFFFFKASESNKPNMKPIPRDNIISIKGVRI